MNDSGAQLDVTKAWISRSLEHEQMLTCCAFSPCGKYLVAGGIEENVQRWDLESGTKTPLVAHRSWVNAVAFHPDGQRLFTADCHGAIHCWPYMADAPTPQWSKSDAHQGWIQSLLVIPDGHLLSAGNDRVIRQWSAENGDLVREFAGHENHVFSLAAHPDGTSFVSGDLNGQVCHWDTATGELVRTFDATALHTRKDTFLADVGGVRSLVFDQQGELLACGGMTDATSNAFCHGNPAILVLDWNQGELRQTLRPQHTSDGPIKGLVFLSDGSLAGHAEKLNGEASLEFWRPDQPDSIHVIKRQSGFCLDIHPDGLQLAAATFKINGRFGNGRHAEQDAYASHDGEIAIFSLCEKES